MLTAALVVFALAIVALVATGQIRLWRYRRQQRAEQKAAEFVRSILSKDADGRPVRRPDYRG